MLFRSRTPRYERSRHSVLPAVEAMEGRALLSAPGASAELASQAKAVAAQSRQARNELISERRQARVAAHHAPATQSATVGQQTDYVVHTVRKGWTLAHSNDFPKVAFSYAKLSVSHDARKVGAAYLGAFVHGDFKTIGELNHTKLVQQLGQEFTDLGSSSRVKSLGKTLTDFGNSVAKGFHRVFG